MKKELVAVLLLFILVLPIVSSQEVPNYSDKYVNDFGKIFNENETLFLRTLLYEVDMNTTAEIVLVSVESCVPYSALEYSLKIGENWKVGKADKDNGMVIVYCKAENKIGVSVGYGLEGILPDSKIGRFLDIYYVPLRDSNQTKEGIINVTEQLVGVIEENREEVLSGQAGPKPEIDYISIFIWIFFAYFILSRIIGAIYKNKNKKDWPWFIPFFIPIPTRSSGGGFGGGGFSGGGGFGGGGFGGGGASR
jgi:uncharacterized protein